MKLSRHILPLLTTLLLVVVSQFTYAQPGFQPDIKKPKPYEERLLKAEKTKEGKLKAPKRIFQNLTTHYNYVFNATNKFKEVIERAKAIYKEDYSQLLTFYNYSLDGTAADSAQLDSVIYKARTGIINHDLRSEWLDELYLLWGAAFHMEKKLDSAYLMFQFINYAYAPQEEAGFYSYIGTHTDGAQELSIATKEKKQLLHSNTFGRNDAFIWQIRTLIELENYTASGSLITTLRRDPAFPKRLGDDLDEMEAYWYYKQQRWDSCLTHLLPVIDGADTKKERARWYYLAAQLMEKTGKAGEAAKYYDKAITLTPDPVLEVYGRLNLVRINKEGGENAVDKNVAELLKMAKRDKYEDYRDIIYYMAAQMEMQNNNIAAAQELLMKGAKYNNGNLASRSKAFLQIADVSYTQKKYGQAASFYDSIQAADLAETEAQRVTQRKPPLKKIVEYSGVVYRQDSLQRIAAMPQAERDAFIKKLVKQLRQQEGLKDEGITTGGSSFANNPSPELFPASQKGEWYFYNTSSKAQGAADFKQVWGNRPNVDNWRRYAVVNQQLLAQNSMNTRNAKGETITPDVVDNNPTSDGLLAKLPFSANAIKASNDSIKKALFNLGTAYLNDIEDYASAITTFEELRKRFPDADKMDEVLFDLYFAYTKAGNPSQAAQVKKALQDRFPSSRYAAIVTTGKDPQATNTASPQATKTYENVYNLYIEGKFSEAENAKRLADSTYKTTFWQPQLLYIEAVYDIKQRNDSTAKKVLQTIVTQNTNKGLTAKAQNLLNVLSHRQQIEDELSRYQMQNGTIDTTKKFVDTTTRRPVVTVSKPVVPTVKKDTALAKPPGVQKSLDTTIKKPVQKPKDTLNKKPVVIKPVDTLVKKQPVLPKSNFIYTYVPDAQHYAVIVLDKVDQVFAGEAKNAFFRYNRERYYNQPLDGQNVTLNADVKLLLIGPFANAQAAVDYALRAKSVAATDIVPWLTGNKYTFSIISAANLELLKAATDFNVYKKFLEVYVPGKF